MGKKSNLSLYSVKEITSPDFLHTLNEEGLEELSDLIRKEIIEVTSNNGGHLSSNLGVVELTIALHRNFDFKKDKLLLDVGHQCYTHKILTGRNISSLRQKNGISGFIKEKESIYDVFESGHSSTSLSAAFAFALDRDNKNENYNVVALIGDASIANGVAFEALNNIPNNHHKVIIILNDNDMAISAPVGGLSNVFRTFQTSKSYDLFKRGFKKIFKFIKPIYNLAFNLKKWLKRHLITTNIFDTLGFYYIGVIDGHDFLALDKAINKAKKTKGSVVIHVRTKKGKGYKYAENDKVGYWHGTTPFNIETGTPKKMHPDYISWSHLFSDFVLEKISNDSKAYLICPGTLKGSGLDQVALKFPNKVIDTGIAEEHAIIVASYLAKLGYHVTLSVYSTFMQRGFDQISHDLARINSNVTFLVDRSGLVGSDGDTHQGIYDNATLISIPNIKIAMPRNSNIAYALYKRSFNEKESTFIHYPRTLTKIVEINKNYSLKEYEIVKEGKNNDVCLLGVGPLLDEVSSLFINNEITIIDPIYLKPISKNLLNLLLTYKTIIIYTPYETISGFASYLTRMLGINKFKGEIVIKAIPDCFVEQMSIDEQLNSFGLSAKQIYEYIKEKILK